MQAVHERGREQFAKWAMGAFCTKSGEGTKVTGKVRPEQDTSADLTDKSIKPRGFPNSCYLWDFCIPWQHQQQTHNRAYLTCVMEQLKRQQEFEVNRSAEGEESMEGIQGHGNYDKEEGDDVVALGEGMMCKGVEWVWTKSYKNLQSAVDEAVTCTLKTGGSGGAKKFTRVTMVTARKRESKKAWARSNRRGRRRGSVCQAAVDERPPCIRGLERGPKKPSVLGRWMAKNGAREGRRRRREKEDEAAVRAVGDVLQRMDGIEGETGLLQPPEGEDFLPRLVSQCRVG